MTAQRRQPSARLTVELSHDAFHRLRLAAADQDVNESTIIVRALELWLAHNPPPGYPPASSELEAAPSTQEAVKQAKGLRRRGLSWPRIADILNREGFLTPRGRPWSRASVARAVRKPDTA